MIVGGGFGGLAAARELSGAPVDVTLVDKRNFHLFQPLLYQVATSGLSPGDIASPIRRLVRRQKNTRVLLGTVQDVDLDRRSVRLEDDALDYDILILAAGSATHYFGKDEWEKLAPGLKTLEDATEMRARILSAFEAAEREPDPARRSAWLTFVVVGGGPTGVELAGALSELSRDALRGDFRSIDPRDAKIVLLEAGDRVLPSYPAYLSLKALRSLEKLGVTVRLGTAVRDVDAEGVEIESNGRSERIATGCALWAAGVKASPLGQKLAGRGGVSADRAGRVRVEPDLTLSGHPEVFVIGDLAHCKGPDGKPAPGIAPVAIQQGRYAARRIRRQLEGRTLEPFRYRHRGDLATIGRRAGVARFGRLGFSGAVAWLLWLWVHLVFLVELENRLLVLLQWTWSYVTRNRSTRLIANTPASADRDEEHELVEAA